MIVVLAAVPILPDWNKVAHAGFNPSKGVSRQILPQFG